MVDSQKFQDQSLKNEAALVSYVETLIREKNSPHVNDKNREDIRKMLLKEVKNGINTKLVAELNDADVAELNKLFERKATDTELSYFFTSKIPEVEKIITQALIDFRNGYLTVVYQPTQKEVKKKEVDLPAPPAPAPMNAKVIN